MASAVTMELLHALLAAAILPHDGWDGQMSEDRILLQGLSFHGYHGTLPAERELGQRFLVDVELHCDLRSAGRSDDLGRTVDYAEVHRRVREIVEGEPANLIETVAERVAAAILANHPRVESVRARVVKPDVRLDDTVLEGAAVEILRHREAGD